MKRKFLDTMNHLPERINDVVQDMSITQWAIVAILAVTFGFILLRTKMN
jgi:hypothetical protein